MSKTHAESIYINNQGTPYWRPDYNSLANRRPPRMASSRHMRRSRRSSPTETPVQDDQTIKTEISLDGRDEDLSEEWTEPPLRAPAPSFEDYKGLERHGVLEHMAPLGTLPGNKVKARLKHHEGPRRGALLKNGDARGAKEEVNTPEPPPALTTRRSEPRRAEDRQSKISSLRERDTNHEYTPDGNAKTTPVKAPSIHAARHGNSSSRTSEDKSKLEKIVDSAVLRASELGDQVLGIAVKQLYEESLHNRELADLLDAVLTQKPTSSQTNQFQSYIKAARKKIRAGEDVTPVSQSKSPAAKSTRTSVARNFASPHSSAPGLNHLSPISKQRASRQHINLMDMNGSSSKDERPAKRMKRSMSVSSDSSLSSLDSAVEDFAPTLEPALSSAPNQPPPRNIVQTRPQPSMGPRLGSFSTRPSDPSTRRPIISSPNPSFVPAPKPAVDITEQRKLLLQKNFSDFISRDSAIRTSPAPVNIIQPAPLTVLAERGQQARLRNGTGLRNKKDEYEVLDSPTSSNYGDLLVPPPPGAARGGTPNQLGRPRKEVKKAARIKMSPMKKQRGVTAGIARGAETESNAVGYGRNDDNQDQGNSDACTACSGEGQLLCCDGCWRAFHFTCIDPPMNQNKPPQGEWFCHKCQEARAAKPRPDRGIFTELAVELHSKNVIAFNLPNQIRDYFEGVKTGEEGEYEDIGNGKVSNKSTTRSGYEELPNNFKLKDNKNDTVLCYRCGKSTSEKREIIPCDFCNLSWHLDCLDPPLATAPRKTSNNGKTKHTWMCPNHIDGLLANLKTNAHVTASKQAQPATGRAYKVRRPKNASIVDIGLRRGFKNNGLIEIENEPTDDESENEKTYPPGVIYRVPEKGLKLDFIDRVKRVNAEEAQAIAVSSAIQSPSAKRRRLNSIRPSTATAPIPAITAVPGPSAAPATNGDKEYEEDFNRRSFSDRKAALNLRQMRHFDSTLSSDKVKNLIATLTAEAPHEVEKLFTSEDNAPTAATDPTQDAEPGAVSEEEQKDLEALMGLIRRRLESAKAVKA